MSDEGQNDERAQNREHECAKTPPPPHGDFTRSVTFVLETGCRCHDRRVNSRLGLSVRTLWRHFRNKESCAEPVLAYGVEWFAAVLRSWPREISFEDHYAAELKTLTQRSHKSDQQADDLAARKMIVLSLKEPALRTAWLMACNQVEREFVAIIASRLKRLADDGDPSTPYAAG